MNTAPKQIAWKKVNWRRSDTDLAAHYGVTRQAVGAARANHSAVASPAGHGGKRANSGRKPKSNEQRQTAS